MSSSLTSPMFLTSSMCFDPRFRLKALTIQKKLCRNGNKSCRMEARFESPGMLRSIRHEISFRLFWTRLQAHDEPKDETEYETIPGCEVWLAWRHRTLSSVGCAAAQSISERSDRLVDRAKKQDGGRVKWPGCAPFSNRYISMAQQPRN